ncbi:HAD family hydrolase [Ruminococcus sp. FC2018]|uniref:HAD family hydrolase n=1 Tax=Ruminococcus sp. FC2018 TaxID=1410617 RepID=UPI00048D13D4|nr:HAD family hydrolase [Ruminococcus sp. FC2018]
MGKKLVFLDIDGTLVDKLETIHPSTIKALELARKNGHRLFISSGRYKGIVPRCLAPLHIDDGVFAAGANVFCGGEVIFNSTFEPGAYDRIIDVLIKHRAMIVAETLESEMLFGENWRSEFEGMKQWILSLGGSFVRRAPKGLSTVGKFVYKSADCSNEQLRSELADICNVITLSYPDSSTGGEIMQPGVNKSVGIQKVLEYYGADISDTIAVGDGANDIEMLEFCAVGAAMGNASEIVKAHADIVTDRIENDGLYKAFELCGLI